MSKKIFFKLLGVKGGSKENTWAKIMKNFNENKEVYILHSKDIASCGDIVKKIVWTKNKKYFQFFLNKKYLNCVWNLKENYGMVDFISILRMKSKFSIIIFRWLSSWANKQKKKKEITVKNLKKTLGISNKVYCENGKFKMSKFKKNTIDVAIREINKLTNMFVVVEPTKIGETSAYKFLFAFQKKH